MDQIDSGHDRSNVRNEVQHLGTANHTSNHQHKHKRWSMRASTVQAFRMSQTLLMSATTEPTADGWPERWGVSHEAQAELEPMHISNHGYARGVIDSVVSQNPHSVQNSALYLSTQREHAKGVEPGAHDGRRVRRGSVAVRRLLEAKQLWIMHDLGKCHVLVSTTHSPLLEISTPPTSLGLRSHTRSPSVRQIAYQ
jgi:hypothetical protein